MSDNTFSLDQVHPEKWYNKGEQLLNTSKLLYTSFRNIDHLTPENRKLRDSYFYSWMMILGFTLENFLKGKLFERYLLKPDALDSFDFNTTIVKDVWGINYKQTHNLIELSKSLDLKLSERDNQVLEDFNLFITHGGRYPIAKKVHKNEAELRGSTANQAIVEGLINRINSLTFQTQTKK